MTSLLKNRKAAWAVLSLGLALSSPVRADLQLTISDSVANTRGNPMIIIDNNTGKFTFSSSKTTTVLSYSFTIDGTQNFTVFTSTSPGITTQLPVSFSPTANSITFTSNTFGDFSINLSSSQNQSPSGSIITSTTTEIGAVSGSGNDILAFGIQSQFTQPSTPSVLLKSTENTNPISPPKNGDPNATATFSSTIGTMTTTPLTVTNASNTPVTTSKYAVGGPSYAVSNLLSVTGLNFSNAGTKDTISVTATTAVLPTPEPGTYVLALTALPAAFVFLRRRKVQA
jgi:hypothetical protein